MNIDIDKYIGYPFDEVEKLLVLNNIEFNVIEVWDIKKTQLGDDLRVINIKGEKPLNIYVSYF